MAEHHSGSFGAMDYHGRRFPSKKALREAIAADPDRVAIEDMSLFGHKTPNGQAMFTANEIKPGHSYGTIVGPDPSIKRTWYATIERKVDGTFKVS